MPRGRGRRLERLLDYAHQLYLNRREADISKKEVATRMDRRTGQMVYLEKTSFDYSGAIKGGRAIGLEAKETNGQTRLYVDPKGKSGLKVHQIEGLIRWGKLGAIAGVAWCLDWDTVLWIDWRILEKFMKELYGKPDKSIKVEWVKQQGCPEVISDGRLDYLDVVVKDDAMRSVNLGSCSGGQQCLPIK